MGSSRRPILRSGLGKRKPVPHFPPLDAFSVLGFDASDGDALGVPFLTQPSPRSRAFWIRTCQQLPIFCTKNAPERMILHYKCISSEVRDPRTPAAGGETHITPTPMPFRFFHRLPTALPSAYAILLKVKN